MRYCPTVRERLAEIDAGAPLRVFTDPDKMSAAANADRAVRHVA